MKRRKNIVHNEQRKPLTRIRDSSGRTNKQVFLSICLALVFVAALPYLQTFRHAFIRFDDGVYVYENTHVQQGLTWSNILWAFTTMSAGNWHPLTWLSHMLDGQIFGLDPGWHHLVNVLLHAGNTLVLFLALHAMTSSVWRSALVAALFALHPLHVESVAWIAERKDVLSTFFGLSALWAYANYVRRPSFSRSAFLLGLFGLSLLSKPMLVTLPFLFFLLDLWPLNRLTFGNKKKQASIIQLLPEKLPLFAMSAVSSIVTWKAQHAAGAVASLQLWPLSFRLSNAVVAYVAYLTKTVWPTDLAIIYPFPDQIPILTTTLAILALLAITITVLAFIRQRSWLTVGWFWFLGTLVPVIGVVQVGAQSMADRYTYFPLIGIFIMLAWSLPATAFAPANRPLLITAGAMIALLLTGLTVLTFKEVRLWKNTVTLFNHALVVTKTNYMAHHLLGGALREQGDLAGAKSQFEQALQIRPDYADTHHDLGTVLLQERDFANAEAHFNVALKSKPLDPMVWNALGMAKAHQGKIDEAVSLYRHALTLNPDYANAYSNLGATLLRQGKYDEAIETCQKALLLRPNHAETHAALAAALWNRNRADEAIFHNRRAIELNPNLIDARYNLGWALLQKADYGEAATQFEYVLRLDPQHEKARAGLSAARQAGAAPAEQP
jgi:tetratricopeptide (TPR) repeat protein